MIRTVECKTWDSLNSKINKYLLQDDDYIWRGQSHNWPLSASLFRYFECLSTPPDHRLALETSAITAFRESILLDYPDVAERIVRSNFDTMIALQHYGCPTRLMDWTRSPYVALYFAVSEMTDYCYLYTMNLTKYQSSIAGDLALDDSNRGLLTHLPDRAYRLYFRNHRIDFPVPFAPAYGTVREREQQTLVMLDLHLGTNLEKCIDNRAAGALGIVKIPKSLMAGIRKQLIKMNIDGAHLFQGLEGHAMKAKEYLTDFKESGMGSRDET